MAYTPKKNKSKPKKKSTADALRESAHEEGLEMQLPLLSNFLGEHIVQFEESEYTGDETTCLKVTCVVLIPGEPDDPESPCLQAGQRVMVLRKLGGDKPGQIAVRKKVFNAFVIRAFGFDSAEEIDTEIPDWPEQTLDSDTPAFLGRVATCLVTASDIVTQKGETINHDTWEPSEEMPDGV